MCLGIISTSFIKDLPEQAVLLTVDENYLSVKICLK